VCVSFQQKYENTIARGLIFSLFNFTKKQPTEILAKRTIPMVKNMFFSLYLHVEIAALNAPRCWNLRTEYFISNHYGAWVWWLFNTFFLFLISLRRSEFYVRHA
jgi:hypothetical protein